MSTTIPTSINNQTPPLPLGQCIKAQNASTGKEYYFVQLTESVSNKLFEDIISKARQNNGQYHYFKATKQRGFIFNKEEEANQFNNSSHITEESYSEELLKKRDIDINDILLYEDHIQNTFYTYQWYFKRKLNAEDKELESLADINYQKYKALYNKEKEVHNQLLTKIDLSTIILHEGTELLFKKGQDGIYIKSNNHFENLIYEISSIKQETTGSNDTFYHFDYIEDIFSAQDIIQSGYSYDITTVANYIESKEYRKSINTIRRLEKEKQNIATSLKRQQLIQSLKQYKNELNQAIAAVTIFKNTIEEKQDKALFNQEQFYKAPPIDIMLPRTINTLNLLGDLTPEQVELYKDIQSKISENVPDREEYWVNTKISNQEEPQDAVRNHIIETCHQLHIEPIIHNTIEELRSNKATELAIRKDLQLIGWHSKGKIHVFMPNIKNKETASKMIMHEAVAHYGLPLLLGKERYNQLCNTVYKSMTIKDKRKYIAYAKETSSKAIQYLDKKNQSRYYKELAGHEYLGFLAMETIDKKSDQTLLEQIKEHIKEFLQKIGLDIITDKELSMIIQESEANLKRGQHASPEASEAETFAVIPIQGEATESEDRQIRITKLLKQVEKGSIKDKVWAIVKMYNDKMLPPHQGNILDQIEYKKACEDAFSSLNIKTYDQIGKYIDKVYIEEKDRAVFREITVEKKDIIRTINLIRDTINERNQYQEDPIEIGINAVNLRPSREEQERDLYACLPGEEDEPWWYRCQTTTTTESINEEQANEIIKQLRKAQPGIKVEMTDKETIAQAIETSKQNIYKQQGEPIAIALSTHRILINRNNIHLDTPFHEFAHQIFDYAKKTPGAENLREAIIKFAEEAPQEIKKRISEENLPKEAYIEELFAYHIASKNEDKLRAFLEERQVTPERKGDVLEWYKTLIKAIEALWNKIKKTFSKGEYADLTIFKAYNKMSTEKLSKEIYKVMMGGKPIKENNIKRENKNRMRR